MSKIILFSGTTEGRQLSEMLSSAEITHEVCVATRYGADMMPADNYANLHVGRMDAEEMVAFLSEKQIAQGDYVIDATHPYATEVTENIERAAARTGATYLRITRAPGGGVPYEGKNGETIRTYDDIGSVVKALEEQEGNILLTTGSKELPVFRENASDELFARTFIRVLPTKESLDICFSEGVDPQRIVAAVGPFSKEMNNAIIRQYHIRHLVTKESGQEGGFEEKVAAAGETGISCHVMKRPRKEEGMSVEEAFRTVTGKKPCDLKRRIILAGYGPGDDRLVTTEVRKAVAEADAIFGTGRLVDGLKIPEKHNGHRPKKYAGYLPDDMIPILEQNREIHQAVVLFTGDSSFYSGAAKMYTRLREWDQDADILILPGISSVSYMAAKIGVSYQDTALCSLHGRKDSKTLHEVIEKIRYTAHTFVLVSGAEDIRDLGKELKRNGIDCVMDLGIDLSYPKERILTIRPEEAASFQSNGIIVAHIFHESHEKRPVMKVLRDEAFTREKVPMTKEQVRHLSLIELEIRQDDIVYDIGGGTGSIAIETANLDPSVRVYTFEKRKEACNLIRKNIDKFHAANVTLVEGTAPDSLCGIADPDSVFIGGSGGRLKEIVDTLRRSKSGIRYVINAVTLETIEEAGRILEEYDVKDARVMQVSVSMMESAGEYHLMRAQNPVTIYSFVL